MIYLQKEGVYKTGHPVHSRISSRPEYRIREVMICALHRVLLGTSDLSWTLRSMFSDDVHDASLTFGSRRARTPSTWP